MDKPLMFLIKLAWACRYRLPILITIGFMALDIRMQLEIHVQMHRIRRVPVNALMGGQNPGDGQAPRIRNNSGDSNSSWMSIDDDESSSSDEDDDRDDAIFGSDVFSNETGEDLSRNRSEQGLLNRSLTYNVLDCNIEN